MKLGTDESSQACGGFTDIEKKKHVQDTHGNGAMIVVRPANNAVAPTVPKRSYIAPANRGNTAAKVDRSALLLAMADAAIGRYAVTRYVNVDVNTK